MTWPNVIGWALAIVLVLFVIWFLARLAGITF